MPQVDKHAPGDFCWIELGTTDQNAAKKFYASLFGWTPNDMPMGADGVYTIFRLNGRDSAAGYTMGKKESAQHVPPHWNLYMAVENADAAAAKATQLGGKVLAPAFDVMDAGRMSVIQDPTGAVFTVWQAKKNAGIGIAGEPGTFCWADLSTPDPERAKLFYSGLFGWKLEAGEKDPSGYLHIKNGGNFIGGIPPTQYRDPKAPPHWLIYFAVADVDATAAKAKHMGARFYLEPMSMEGVGAGRSWPIPRGLCRRSSRSRGAANDVRGVETDRTTALRILLLVEDLVKAVRIGFISLLLALPAYAQHAQSIERRIFQAINQVRQENKLPPLEWSAKIAEVARSHSMRMAAKRFFSHQDPKFGGPDSRLSAAQIAWRLCGENIFEEYGEADPVRAAVRGWMQSSGHRKNILTKGFTHTGIGVAMGRGGTYTITQMFAAF